MQPKTVLVVEDDRDIRWSMEQFLEEEGYAVVTASDGQAALERIPHLPKPSVILLDLMMPKLDGYGVLRDLENHPEKRDSHPIFLLTANWAQLSPDMSRLLGNLGIPVLAKPFDIEQLSGQVHSAFVRLEGKEAS